MFVKMVLLSYILSLSLDTCTRKYEIIMEVLKCFCITPTFVWKKLLRLFQNWLGSCIFFLSLSLSLSLLQREREKEKCLYDKIHILKRAV